MVSGPGYGAGVALGVKEMKESNSKKPTKKKAIGTNPLPSRRSFLNKLWLVLGVLAIAEVAGLVIAFLKPRKPRAQPEGLGGWITCGPVEDFSTGTVTAFQRGHFYLSRLEDGGFLALSRKCTHLGCTVIWDEEKSRFECPCHASAFNLMGDVISKPAPRALDYYAVSIENSIVTVDTGKKLKRKRFSAEQATKI